MAKYFVGVFPNLELANEALREIKHLNLEVYHENIVSKETAEDYSADRLIEDHNIGNTGDLLIGAAVTAAPFGGALAAMHPNNIPFPQELDNSLLSGLIQLAPPLRYREEFQELYEKGYALYSLQTEEKNKRSVEKIFKAHRAFSVEEI